MLQILPSRWCTHKGRHCRNGKRQLCQKKFLNMHISGFLDERIVAAQRQGRISFYFGLLQGEEASTVAVAAATWPQRHDYVQYREQYLGVFVVYSTNQFMDQMFSNGKKIDLKGGKAYSLWGKRNFNFIGRSRLAPRYPNLRKASGLCLWAKWLGKPAVTICVIWRGRCFLKVFHAVKLWLLVACIARVIFFCRNNGLRHLYALWRAVCGWWYCFTRHGYWY